MRIRLLKAIERDRESNGSAALTEGVACARLSLVLPFVVHVEHSIPSEKPRDQQNVGFIVRRRVGIYNVHAVRYILRTLGFRAHLKAA